MDLLGCVAQKTKPNLYYRIFIELNFSIFFQKEMLLVLTVIFFAGIIQALTHRTTKNNQNLLLPAVLSFSVIFQMLLLQFGVLVPEKYLILR